MADVFGGMRDVRDYLRESRIVIEHSLLLRKQVRKGGRSSQYEGALPWLLSAGLITKCIRVTSGQVPLKLQEDMAAFKVYMNDTGLLSTMSGMPASALFDARGRAMLGASRRIT